MEVQSLLHEGAIDEVFPSGQGGGQGVLLLLLRVDQGDRRLLPYSEAEMSECLPLHREVRMETQASIIRDLHPGAWVIFLNLKDAYLHVAIHPSR